MRGSGLYVVILLIMALALLAACGAEGTAEPPATQVGTGSVLPDTRWVLTSLQGQPLLPGTNINLEFGEQWFSGFTGCNYYGGGPDSGAYTATDEGSLTIGGLAVTLIACPEEIMAQEKAYTDALAGTAAYRLGDDRLELQDAAGKTILVYARQAECAGAPADLAGSAWQLISVDDQALGQGSATILAFVDDKWFVEQSACEAYVSGYQAAGYDLRSGFSAWLGRFCQDEAGQGVTMIESPRDTCLAQGRLQISTVAGKVFIYEPLPEAAQPALEGPTWSLLSIVGERPIEGEAFTVLDPNPVLEGTEITLRLAGNMASGSAGCNTYQAAYGGGMALTFGPAATTKKACLTPERVMEQEQRYLEALQAVTGYRIAGSQLWLRTADGRALVFAVGDPGARPGVPR